MLQNLPYFIHKKTHLLFYNTWVFVMNKVWQNFQKLFSRALSWAQTSLFWRVDGLWKKIDPRAYCLVPNTDWLAARGLIDSFKSFGRWSNVELLCWRCLVVLLLSSNSKEKKTTDLLRKKAADQKRLYLIYQLALEYQCQIHTT